VRIDRRVAFLGFSAIAAVGLAACSSGAAAPPSSGGDKQAAAAGESSAAPTSTGDVVPGRTITVVGSGDFLIHNTLWMQAQSDGGGQMDFSPQVAGIKKRIAPADFAICQQETPFAKPTGPFSGYPVFSTPPQLVKTIKDTGYDACGTVSNHTLDGGMDGIKRTLDALDAAGIGHAGSARTAEEAATPHIYDVDGVKMAYLSYAYDFNGYKRPAGKEWCCNLINADQMIADAKKAREAGAQLVIMNMHGGDENSSTPNALQKNTAAAIAASGQVDALFGQHVHVVQPVQKIGNMWVVYGEGNLVSGQYDSWKRNKEGVIVSLTFTQADDGTWSTTKAVGYPTLNTSAPIRVHDLVSELPKSGGDSRMLEAYQQTKKTVLSMGAAKDGFVVPDPGGQ